ncbi:DUF2339 domain-containing protein [Psychrobacter arenosus]|uniref:DUF2339 domain-containing protein n=1 Tax=Psychrobacter arenosus TaxID=256326 RepID=UPI00191896FB|nr:DUF2339 domain-containing protein [Psychrobacter arenosus]
MMLYLLLEQPGWLAFIVLFIIVVVMVGKANQRIALLRRDVDHLKEELNQVKQRTIYPVDATNSRTNINTSPLVSTAPRADNSEQNRPSQESSTSQTLPTTPADALAPPNAIFTAETDTFDATTPAQPLNPTPTLSKPSTAPMEPDERSLPMVTSLVYSLKNWFLGGNLVVRVGVIVLLVGVVLLLRLLSEFIEIPIGLKLGGMVVAGLALAGLGLKLAKQRFTYGITLQGTGLAIAYLSTFFAYRVYHVISSLPSFVALGILAALTVALAVRQNAFPLALLALSGGFFAPILTGTDTGSLVTLFSYYLLLNVAIAVIAHYRTWKVLNLLGAMVTFGFAYYLGLTENLSAAIDSQRWSLVVLVALHLALYLFVVIRYAQQIIAYNTDYEATSAQPDNADSPDVIHSVKSAHSAYLFPIDIGLLFSVPILAFGLFPVLLNDINHALTITSAVLAAVYLTLSALFIKRSQRYALITEGMLALGCGFLALVIPLAFDAEWIAGGWSLQGLALVWFGRRSLRAWSVLFGIGLQLVSVGLLVNILDSSTSDFPTLTLTLSALSALASVFILRASNSPLAFEQSVDSLEKTDLAQDATASPAAGYATSLGISQHAAQQWLSSINQQSVAFQVLWRSPIMTTLLTLVAMIWTLFVLTLDLDHWFRAWQFPTSMLIALAALISLIGYLLINRYRAWQESRQFSHGIAILFYLMLVIQLPQHFEFHSSWLTGHWLVFAGLVLGWLIVGQLWIKTWQSHRSSLAFIRLSSASWLATGILLLAASLHYGLPASKGVMPILIPTALLLVSLWVSHRQNNNQRHLNSAQRPLPWFDWQQALLDNANIFLPFVLVWVIVTNAYYDGVIWSLSYFPALNLYDIAAILTLIAGLGTYYLQQQATPPAKLINGRYAKNLPSPSNFVFIVLGLISFWHLSSMLVRTLHAFSDTPLWYNGAWDSEKVQTGLTILWTLTALVATIIASRYWQRLLWFMGIGLLGLVVLKLVLVDLSQTEAIWRVVSFIGAGSLILLIGYLAPLPPLQEDKPEDALKGNGES